MFFMKALEKHKTFTQIPTIGPSLAQDLIDLGFIDIHQLKGKDPQKLYDQFCKLKKQKVDRCVLYAFRLVVYFASHKKKDPKKLKWWAFKD
ncbi:MAG: hypothetical protein K940chlam8_00008 [Chlamydiae bacterium]|nr:hypothetical protein [Chlamydiota bacterium]